MTKTIEIMDKQIFTEILKFFTKMAQAKIYARSQLQGKYNYTRVDTTHNVISKVYKKEDNIKHYEEIDASWFDKGLKCIHFMNGNAQNKNRAFRHANFHIYNPNLQTYLAIEIGPIFSENKTLDNSSDDNYDTICGYYVTLFETGYEKHKNIDKQTKDYDKEFYKTFALTDIDGIYAYVNELLSKIPQNMKPDNPFLNSVIELLQSNGNIILTGAPGTGKTYLAKQIAEAMKAESAFVQFHPSYDYTDFVEGLRPTSPDDNGNIGFERTNGVFKDFCKKALADCKYKDVDTKPVFDEENSKKFIFIIDEINRGEKGKVQTQYQNLVTEKDKNGKDEPFYKGFYVPENVYIIGTMNDIDRSVESFDFAMRRRFTWKEIKAEDSQKMFENEDWKDEAIKRMNSLNNAISNIQGLGSAYHIGAAYFKNNLPKYTDNPLENVWNYHLKPLLFEYLRGMPDAETKLKELENAYNLKSNTTNEQGTSN
ncbi:hypothetical protein FACS189440_01800 [Bacteroidia bacterium]|nr:hypothetical protein FACS189423_03820 [Bacteroidia bacterium]GHT45568.1 hypothetical protein FACS189440_01800 [Bacteroidia bacterium]